MQVAVLCVRLLLVVCALFFLLQFYIFFCLRVCFAYLHALVSFLVSISCFSFVFSFNIYVCFIFQFEYAYYLIHVLRYVMKLQISTFCVSGDISYMKSRGLIAPLLVLNVYDACNCIHKIFSSYLVLMYIDF